jgi:hypothetical protein
LCSQAWGYEISVPTLVIGGGRERFYPTDLFRDGTSARMSSLFYWRIKLMR